MRFFSICTTALSVLASIVVASENPIVYPDASTSVAAGDTLEIKWNPTAGNKVGLKLRFGKPQNLQTGVTIAASVANTGSFFWTVPKDIGNGQWSIAIDNGKETDANYSPMFAIAGGSGKQGSPGSASATAAPTTASITLNAFLATATGGPTASNAAKPVDPKQIQMGFGLAAALGMGALVI